MSGAKKPRAISPSAATPGTLGMDTGAPTAPGQSPPTQAKRRPASFTCRRHGGDLRIKVESKQDIQRRTGEPSGNAADAVLMTLVVNVAEAPAPAAVEPDPRPKVFLDHFARLRRQREARAGYLIA